MYWGSGSGLGILTMVGYVIFTIGAALVWRRRDDFFVWVHDEFGAVGDITIRHLFTDLL